jgi:hypothetical protein
MVKENQGQWGWSTVSETRKGKRGHPGKEQSWWYKAFQAMVRTLSLTLSNMGSHQRVLRRGKTRSDLDFNRIALVSVLRIGQGTAESGWPIKSLLQFQVKDVGDTNQSNSKGGAKKRLTCVYLEGRARWREWKKGVHNYNKYLETFAKSTDSLLGHTS